MHLCWWNAAHVLVAVLLFVFVHPIVGGVYIAVGLMFAGD